MKSLWPKSTELRNTACSQSCGAASVHQSATVHHYLKYESSFRELGKTADQGKEVRANHTTRVTGGLAWHRISWAFLTPVLDRNRNKAMVVVSQCKGAANFILLQVPRPAKRNCHFNGRPVPPGATAGMRYTMVTELPKTLAWDSKPMFSQSCAALLLHCATHSMPLCWGKSLRLESW